MSLSYRRTLVRVLGPLALGFPALLTGACSGDSSPDDDATSDAESAENAVTWHEHIAPLVVEKCVGCHSEGGIGPVTFQTYAEAKMWAPQMNRDIQRGAMPPWAAQNTEECTPPGSFKDDLRLSDDEKGLFAQWLEDGLLEGDPKDAAELTEAAELVLTDADRQLIIPSAVSVEGSGDEFICFTLDPEITEPSWLTGSQIVAGNQEIAHHALLFLDRDGESVALADEAGKYPCFGDPNLSSPILLAAWAPGSVPALMPENAGTPPLPGDRMVVQMHYHPTNKGQQTDDSTRIDLRLTTTEPDYVSNILLIGNFARENAQAFGGEGYGLTTGPDFLIPAGAENHVEINRFLLPDGGEPANALLPISLWSVGTHMHYVGVDMKINVTRPDGEDQCLIHTPEWDFNWQRQYFFDGEIEDMPTVHLGDSLTMRCTYDNSMNNAFVRAALADQGLEEPVDVVLGEETLDEMCLGVFGVAVPKEYKEAIGL